MEIGEVPDKQSAGKSGERQMEITLWESYFKYTITSPIGEGLRPKLLRIRKLAVNKGTTQKQLLTYLIDTSKAGRGCNIDNSPPGILI